MEKAIRELVELSRYAAEHPRFVQGGGGNCSVKFSGKMAIKASGYFLEKVSEKAGYVLIDLKTGLPVGETGLRASMEAPLHGLLNTYVIHTHPVAVGAMVCAKEGKQISRELFPGSCYQWIDYAAPGKCLFEKVRKCTAQVAGEGVRDQVLFLANHGLFVSSQDKEQCIHLHEETVRRVESFLREVPVEELPPVPSGAFLTPDMVVYRKADEGPQSEKQKKAEEEAEVFARKVLALMAAKRWTPAWLAGLDVACLLEMQEEQYRKKLLGNPG